MDPITIVAAVDSLITLAERLIDRGKQTGELTDEQAAALQARATAAFAKRAQPAPPPAGG